MTSHLARHHISADTSANHTNIQPTKIDFDNNNNPTANHLNDLPTYYNNHVAVIHNLHNQIIKKKSVMTSHLAHNHISADTSANHTNIQPAPRPSPIITTRYVSNDFPIYFNNHVSVVQSLHSENIQKEHQYINQVQIHLCYYDLCRHGTISNHLICFQQKYNIVHQAHNFDIPNTKTEPQQNSKR